MKLLLILLRPLKPGQESLTELCKTTGLCQVTAFRARMNPEWTEESSVGTKTSGQAQTKRGVSRGEQALDSRTRACGEPAVEAGPYLRGFAPSGTLAMQTAKSTAASQDPMTRGEAKKQRHETQFETTGEGIKKKPFSALREELTRRCRIIKHGQNNHNHTVHRCSSGPDNKAVNATEWMRGRHWAGETQS